VATHHLSTTTTVSPSHRLMNAADSILPLGPLGDVPAAEMRAALHRMADWVADYREGIEGRRIVPAVVPGEVSAGLTPVMPESGDPLDAILRDLDTVVMPGVVHWGHPAFLGYFGSTSNGPALLGEIAAAALNVSAMTWRTSPSATELETVVLRWISDLVGLPASFMGIVYDTASVALLHALAAAREEALSGVRARGLAGRDDVRTLRLYASDQAHSSLEKAAIMLGIGESNVVRLPSDPSHRMSPDLLQRAIEADRANGALPLAVIATVGTTTSAAVDPVPAIADVCARQRVWLHVDAAYGGAIGALPEGRWLLAGVERADSVIVNPHKWLFVPLDFSTLYMKHPDALRRVFSLVPEYLRGDASSAACDRGAAIDYMDFGVQLGRRFRALKAWMALRAFGRAGIASRIREHCRLAGSLAARIAAEPDFELATPVSMSIVCFRYVPSGIAGDEADRLNAAIVAAVNASGAAYLTHSVLAGRTVMRVGFGNIATTEQHLDAVWRAIVQESKLSFQGEKGRA
jgi:aromatic-L-amino-acid/L-tryptophan decarboxylase